MMNYVRDITKDDIKDFDISEIHGCTLKMEIFESKTGYLLIAKNDESHINYIITDIKKIDVPQK